MIKVYVRAIVATKTSFVLLGEQDKTGKQTWDLPGGELQAGQDMRELLTKLVLQNTGYAITNLKFFEIVCRLKPRTRSEQPVTVIDFIFTSEVTSEPPEPASEDIDLLDFEKFEWLASGGQFHLNKVMSLLTKYHKKHINTHDSRLRVIEEPDA